MHDVLHHLECHAAHCHTASSNHADVRCVIAEAAAEAGSGAYNAETGMYEIVAGRKYNTGDQVFLTYGHYTNVQLLETYGFLLPHNAHDEVTWPDWAWPDSVAKFLASQRSQGFIHPGVHLAAVHVTLHRIPRSLHCFAGFWYVIFLSARSRVDTVMQMGVRHGRCWWG